MKILHITDSHGTVKSPEGRRDIYYFTFLKKLHELGYVIKAHGIDMVIHTGDLFHTARVSDRFTGQVAEQILAWGVPVYVIPGNHDIEGYTIDTMDQTKLGLLATTEVIKLLDRDHPVMLTVGSGSDEYTVAISGQEYYAHIDEGNPDDLNMQQDEADFNILCYHGYIADTPQHPNIKHITCSNVLTDADVILSGHYHRQFSYSGSDFDIYNPGSMMRVEQTEYNKKHMPMYGILELGLTPSGSVQYSYNFYEFRCAQPSTTVFDYNAKYQAKAHAITLDGFKDSIAATMQNISKTATIQDIILDLAVDAAQTMNVPVTFPQDIVNYHTKILQTIPDEFEVKSGYTESQKTKKVAKVVIKNFQSHEHTELEFSDGLNIIVGESNNGKTAVLRAMMWCIDNQPLGNDFIMAGKKDCSVRIIYDDGSYIERGRTMKDTGYYQVGYFDENGTFQEQQYRGFTNAVPVEVMNIHQMPEVNITKDISTHLNLLSQLDGPFLLTQSPQVKASAIGRITGTHTVDAAIKECNKEILGNSKTVKVHEESLKETQQKIAQLPDLDILKKVFRQYSKSVNLCENMATDNDKVRNWLLQEQTVSVAIQDNERIIDENKQLTSIKRYVQITYERYQKIKQIASYIQQIQELETRIAETENVLWESRPVAALKPILLNYMASNEHTKMLITHINQIADIGNMVVMNKGVVADKKSFAYTMKCIVDYGMFLHDRIKTISSRLHDIKKADDNVKVAKYSADQKRENVEEYKTAIAKFKETRNKEILEMGICPCCGQPINESHVQTIVSFCS